LYDKDGGGDIDMDEFLAVMADVGFSSEEARRMFKSVDKDGGGT
jgi:Ca2+-binding EF-hand superfamily protein